MQPRQRLRRRLQSKVHIYIYGGFCLAAYSRQMRKFKETFVTEQMYDL